MIINSLLTGRKLKGSWSNKRSIDWKYKEDGQEVQGG